MAWKLVDEEAKMLFKDEIPMFLIPCGQDAMRFSNGTALPFRCGVDIAKQRLERLNPEWIDYQSETHPANLHQQQRWPWIDQ